MLVFITNRKSHMGFRLLPQSVTFSDLERHNDRCLAFFFTEFGSFEATNIKVVEDRPIQSATRM